MNTKTIRDAEHLILLISNDLQKLTEDESKIIAFGLMDYYLAAKQAALYSMEHYAIARRRLKIITEPSIQRTPNHE